MCEQRFMKNLHIYMRTCACTFTSTAFALKVLKYEVPNN